jgi:succinate-semialdehyde dehydrogenase/glutarate-semialdehyde dehydrogenase
MGGNRRPQARSAYSGLSSSIASRADAIAEVISRSTGKTRVDALSTEVLPSAMAASYYARIAPRVHQSQKIERGNILFSRRNSSGRRSSG